MQGAVDDLKFDGNNNIQTEGANAHSRSTETYQPEPAAAVGVCHSGCEPYHRKTNGDLAPYEQIRRFLETCFADDDLVELRFIGEFTKEVKRYPHSEFDYAFRWKKSEMVSEKNQNGFNVYIGVNPRKCIDGSESGVERVVTAHADIDDVAPEQVETVLAKYGIKSSVIVASNVQTGGCHVYVALRETSLIPSGVVGRKIIDRHVALNKRLIGIFKNEGMKADDVQDIPRILRLPGVMNIPDKRKLEKGRAPSPCVLHSCDPSISYTVEELEALLPQLYEPVAGFCDGIMPVGQDVEAFSIIDQHAPIKAVAESSVARDQRTNWARQYANSIGVVTEGKRHKTTFTVAANCIHNHGLNTGDALSITADFNRICCRPPLDESEIDKQVADAVKYGKQTLWTPNSTATFTEAERTDVHTKTHTHDPKGVVCASESVGIGNSGKQNPSEISLPEIVDGVNYLGTNLPNLQSDVWDGILKYGSKLFVGGPSKAKKSFSLIGLAIAVAKGINYWGRSTRKSKVLYLNLEIHSASFAHRLQRVQDSLGVKIEPGELNIWNLRGFAMPIEDLVPSIIARTSQQSYGMVIVDPTYKCLGKRNENDAGDMTSFCNQLEKISQATGAAVVSALHFAKGNSSGKETIDRISGSGVMARDPDAMLLLTPHETEGAFTVSAVLREHAPLPDWCIRWDHPLMILDDSLNPKALKGANNSANPIGLKDILEACALPGSDEKLRKPRSSIETAVKEETGAGINRIKEVFSDAISQGLMDFIEKPRKGTLPLKLYSLSESGKVWLDNQRFR